MRKFERIRVEKGQAYIRDTGITVSEIVKKVVYEKASDKVLSEYPTIETHDIEEALAYAVGDLIETVAIWRNEGLGPLTSVKGYSKLLLEYLDLTQDQKRQFTETIFRSSHQAIAKWQNFSSWVYKTYRPENDQYQSFSVTSIVQDVLRELPEYDPVAQVKWDIADGLPNVRAGYDLTTAIVNLLTDRTALMLKRDSVFEISSKNNGFVDFKVLRHFEYENHRDLIDAHILGWASSPLSLAAAIIREHGSELKFHSSPQTMIFEFELSIWEENS